MKTAIISKSDIVKRFAEKHGVPIIDIKTSESMTQTVDPITVYDYAGGKPL